MYDYYDPYNNYYYDASMIMGGTAKGEIKYFINNYNNYDIKGTYFSFFFFYRRVTIESIYSYYFPVPSTNKVTHNLNIFFPGITLGYNFLIGESFLFNIYVGTGMRLARYDHEKKISQFRRFGTIGYSGITPTVGMKIGITK